MFPTIEEMARSVLITERQIVWFYKPRINSSEQNKMVVVSVVFILTLALNLQYVQVCTQFLGEPLAAYLLVVVVVCF